MMELINNIPSDWEITKLKYFSKIFGRIGFRGYTASDLVDEGEGAITLGPPNIVNQKLNLENKRYLSWEKFDESPEIKVYNGDLLLVKTASVGKVALVENLNEPTTINPQLVVFKNIKINSKFFYYTMVSDVIQFQIAENLNGGVISTLSQENIQNYVIPLPKSSEQQKIVAYLDNHIDRIDNVISLNEKLISLLEDKRVALINQIVTKGLNPNVQMKDTGIEWIGKIPDHWDIIKLKHCTGIVNNKKDFADITDKYIGLENIESETGKLLNYSNDGAEGTVNKFKKDMVLFGKLRPYLAKVINPSFDGVCSTELLVFKTNNLLIPKYLFYFMLSNRFIEQVNSSTYGVKMPRASPEFIYSLPITIPNISEQEKIVLYLNNNTLKIDQTITKIKENIKLLDEYKTSLIHHVITGKIKVTNEV